MGSEDLVGEQEDEDRDYLVQDKQTSGPGDLEEKINYLRDWAERKTGMTHWKRGRCGRMCRGTCPLGAPDQ